MAPTVCEMDEKRKPSQHQQQHIGSQKSRRRERSKVNIRNSVNTLKFRESREQIQEDLNIKSENLEQYFGGGMSEKSDSESTIGSEKFGVQDANHLRLPSPKPQPPELRDWDYYLTTKFKVHNSRVRDLMGITLRTINLMHRNRLLQRQVTQLQLETQSFFASVMANPENRHFLIKSEEWQKK